MTRFVIALAIAAALGAPAACALQTSTITVTHEDGRYTATAVFLIDAPRASVYAVLTDYDLLERISPQIEQSELLGHDSRGRPLVRIVTHSCVLFFCRTVATVEVVEESPPGAISTRVLPAQSDLEYGATEWRLEAIDGRTRLTWRTSFVPDFWVPPLIGPPAIKHVLENQLTAGAAGIERLARALRSDF